MDLFKNDFFETTIMVTVHLVKYEYLLLWRSTSRSETEQIMLDNHLELIHNKFMFLPHVIVKVVLRGNTGAIMYYASLDDMKQKIHFLRLERSYDANQFGMLHNRIISTTRASTLNRRIYYLI